MEIPNKPQTLEEFNERREMKKPNLPKIVSDESILALRGEYMFDNWGICYIDFSDYDFSNCSLETMTKLCFSSSTKWPTADKLPKGFNPQEILKQATTTNEDVKNLHKKGINGEGITVAVLDSGFQGQNHIEFENAELIKCTLDNEETLEYHFHMEDVLSKLCGKNLGIAPKVKVLYYECSTDYEDSESINKALKDILRRINQGENIRIVNRSGPFSRGDEPLKYEKENLELVEVLRSKNCEVIYSDLFGEKFFCCGTSFLNKENDINQYEPASFLNAKYKEKTKSCINILCSGRTIPEFCTTDGYKYEVVDCFSWTIPQGSGYYALCLQINPNLTFKQFTDVCQRSCDISSSGLNVLNAQRLIENVKLLTNEKCL